MPCLDHSCDQNDGLGPARPGVVGKNQKSQLTTLRAVPRNRTVERGPVRIQLRFNGRHFVHVKLFVRTIARVAAVVVFGPETMDRKVFVVGGIAIVEVQAFCNGPLQSERHQGKYRKRRCNSTQESDSRKKGTTKKCTHLGDKNEVIERCAGAAGCYILD